MHLKYIMEMLNNKGYKNTPQRRAIIQSLLALDKRPTAKEIYVEVQEAFPEISLDTIYRNLDILVDIGVVDQLNLRSKESNRFELSVQHHHHMVCLQCGETICLDYCPFNNCSLTQAEANEFKVVGHAFEIYGYCSSCQKAG